MEKDPVKASAALAHYARVLQQRLLEMEEAAKLVASATVQVQEGAITLAEYQMVVLNLASFITQAMQAAEQQSFASGAKLTGW